MSILLILIALTLLVVIMVQIAKASELSEEINDEPVHGEKQSNIHGYLMLAFIIAGLIGVAYCFYHFKQFLFPVSASEHGKQLDFMFDITLIFTMAVFVPSQFVLFWFAFRYREKKDGVVKFFPHNNKLEMIWTIIPSIVLTVLVVLGIKTWLNIFDKAPEESLVVEINAKQFQWVPRYAGEDGMLGERGIDFVMAFKDINKDFNNELGINWDDQNSFDDIVYPTEIHVLVNHPVVFKLHALDVLHSFYLPFFRVKMDCVPGIPTQFWMKPTITTDSMRTILKDHSYYWTEINPKTNKPRYETFVYELACAELCGKSHYNMRLPLYVDTEEQFAQWQSEQQSHYEKVVAEQLNRTIIKPEIPETISADSFQANISYPLENSSIQLTKHGK